MPKKMSEANRKMESGSGKPYAAAWSAQWDPAAGGIPPALFTLAAGLNPGAGNKAWMRRKFEDRQKALFDNVPEIAWIKDRDGRFIAASALFADACGMPHEELIGKTDWDIWPRELAEKYTAQDKKVVDSGRPIRAAVSSNGKNGANRWSEIVRTPVLDHDGAVLGTLGIARDISAHKEAASHLRRVARKVMRAREEEKKKISNLLHDELGSLIMRLDSSLSLMAAELRGKGAACVLGRIKGTKRTVRELAARIRDICFDIRPPAMGVSGLAGAVAELARRVAVCTAVKICCDIRLADEKKIDDLVKIIIYRIVQESLNNAVKHSAAKTVKISAGSSGGRLKLSISDDGKGFDPDSPPALKIEPALGLRIMREEAESVCAVLSVDSIPGFGTVVRGDFPFQPCAGGDASYAD